MSENEFDEYFRSNEESIARGESEQNCKEDEDREEETELVTCAICGNEVNADEAVDSLGQGYVCKDCIDKKRTLDNVLKYSNWIDNGINIGGFFWSCITDECVIKMLKEKFCKYPKWKQKEYIDNFINNDKSSFAEYLIEEE